MRRFLQRLADLGIDLARGLSAGVFFLIAVAAGVACLASGISLVLSFLVGGVVVAALAVLTVVSLLLALYFFDVG